MAKAIRGIIKGATFQVGRIYGKVYCDVQKQFTDGEPIITSPVSYADATHCHTKNSVYLIEWKKP